MVRLGSPYRQLFVNSECCEPENRYSFEFQTYTLYIRLHNVFDICALVFAQAMCSFWVGCFLSFRVVDCDRTPRAPAKHCIARARLCCVILENCAVFLTKCSVSAHYIRHWLLWQCTYL